MKKKPNKATAANKKKKLAAVRVRKGYGEILAGYDARVAGILARAEARIGASL